MVCEDHSEMGGSQSRRSARIATRQAEEQAAQEESDPDYAVEEDEDVSEDDAANDIRIRTNDESDSEDSSDEEPGQVDVRQFFLQLTGMMGTNRRGRSNNLAKRIKRFGPVPTNPPPMVNDLSQEIERNTGAETLVEPTTTASRQQPSGPGVRTNAALMVWRRRANLSGSCSGWASPQCCHMSGLHFLPNRPLKLRDRMGSRAYIGQYSRHGDLFVGAFQSDKRVRIYDTGREWEVVKDVHARSLRWTITDTTLSKDQAFLLYATMNPVVHMVNVAAGGVESEANVTEIHEALHFDEVEGSGSSRRGHFGVFSIQWSADGKEILAGTADERILIFDAVRAKTTTQIRAHTDDVNAVVFLDDTPNILVSGSDDNLIKVWDRRALSRNSQPAGVLVGHTQGLTHLDPKGDGRYLLSNCKDQTAKVWDVRRMVSHADFERLPDPSLPEFGWDYRWMTYPLRDINVRHPNDCSVQTLRGHHVTTTLIRAYWSPMHTTGQRFVYSASADGAVYIYDTVSGALVDRLSYHKPELPNHEILRDVSWHPYEQRIVTAGFDGALVEWGYSAESMSHHLNSLPDTGYDNLEDNW